MFLSGFEFVWTMEIQRASLVVVDFDFLLYSFFFLNNFFFAFDAYRYKKNVRHFLLFERRFDAWVIFFWCLFRHDFFSGKTEKILSIIVIHFPFDTWSCCHHIFDE